MKKLFILVVLAVAALAFVGFRRGWLHLDSGGDDKSANVSVSVDKEQMKQDAAKALEKAEVAAERAKEKVEAAAEKH